MFRTWLLFQAIKVPFIRKAMATHYGLVLEEVQRISRRNRGDLS